MTFGFAKKRKTKQARLHHQSCSLFCSFTFSFEAAALGLCIIFMSLSMCTGEVQPGNSQPPREYGHVSLSLPQNAKYGLSLTSLLREK